MTPMNRRTILMASASVPLHAALAPVLAQAPSPTKAPAPASPGLPSLGPAQAVTTAAQNILATFSPDQRATATFPWNGPQWRRWDYFGASGYTKPGLRLEQMSPTQKDAVWTLFTHVLSSDGITKAQNVMRLQESLIEEGDAPTQRSPERFSFSVFGAPAAQGMWGVRLEGHHLSLSFAIRDDQIVSVTPQAFAVRPARVLKGRHKGLVTIGPEENLARALMADLAPPQQKSARVAERHLFNILSTAGRERANAQPIGLSGANMSTGQQDLLRQLIETYAVKPYAKSIAAAQTQRLAQTRMEAVHFAWYGDNTRERAFGYRVISPTFVIEMGSIDGAAQHLHPIYHDLGNVLGSSA